MGIHIVQSPEWGDFKTIQGTPAIRAGNVQYTLHKIPYTGFNFGYCPKVDPCTIDWDLLRESAIKNKCIAINFDVPNIVKEDPCSLDAVKIMDEHCIPSPRDTFAKSNILLDISKDDEELMMSMHTKHRYNIRLAQRKGLVVKRGETIRDFEIFYTLFADTAVRQKYYIHPKSYYRKIWELLYPKGICHILTAYYHDEALASWMLFTYDGVLYYPYGGSSEKHKNLFASTLVCWESIQLGKEKGCKVFDMWGAANDPNDKNDPWYGFTNFKLKFGGKFVEYLDSYDYVVNKPMYVLFNYAQNLRWKLLRVMKR